MASASRAETIWPSAIAPCLSLGELLMALGQLAVERFWQRFDVPAVATGTVRSVR